MPTNDFLGFLSKFGFKKWRFVLIASGTEMLSHVNFETHKAFFGNLSFPLASVYKTYTKKNIDRRGSNDGPGRTDESTYSRSIRMCCSVQTPRTLAAR